MTEEASTAPGQIPVVPGENSTVTPILTESGAPKPTYAGALTGNDDSSSSSRAKFIFFMF